MLPALNIRGLNSGNVGEKAQNAVPPEASASIDFRLVPGQSPDKVRKQVEGFIRTLGYEVVHGELSAAERRQAPKFVRMTWEGGYPDLIETYPPDYRWLPCLPVRCAINDPRYSLTRCDGYAHWVR